jgi:hypothetical protein
VPVQEEQNEMPGPVPGIRTAAAFPLRQGDAEAIIDADAGLAGNAQSATHFETGIVSQ